MENTKIRCNRIFKTKVCGICYTRKRYSPEKDLMHCPTKNCRVNPYRREALWICEKCHNLLLSHICPYCRQQNYRRVFFGVIMQLDFINHLRNILIGVSIGFADYIEVGNLPF